MSIAHTQTCPIAASLNEIGDMWTLMIVREAMYGASRFKDFQANTGIARNLLSSRLAKMVEAKILAKHDFGKSGTRHEYRLTSKGRALAPVMVALSQWGNQWVYGEGREPVLLVDGRSNEPVAPLQPVQEDGTLIDWSDVVLTVGPGASSEMRNRFRHTEKG